MTAKNLDNGDIGIQHENRPPLFLMHNRLEVRKARSGLAVVGYENNLVALVTSSNQVDS